MRLLVGLIKFTFNMALLLLGAAAILGVFAFFSAVPWPLDTSRVSVGNGAGWLRPLTSQEGWRLYNALKERADELNTPLSNDTGLVGVSIAPGEAADQVAARLQALGLINDAGLFAQLLRYNNLDTRLQTGEYQLRRNMTMREVGGALSLGRSAQFTVMVPSGWRLEQLADHLQTNGVMDGRLFWEQARRGTLINHPILRDRPAGQSYEGYLLPGTYTLPENPTPADLISQMLDRLAGQLPPDAFSVARQRGLSLHQVLTIASIVERETAQAEERPLVASVYLNRLQPGSGEPYLRADPTVQYAMGYQPDSGQWWKSPVQLEEYQAVDSPYNTYRYPGLPPGPIASPSLEAIVAVLYPAQSDYLFFVCRRPHCEGGNHVFSKTYEEHLQNVQVYWGQ